MIDLHNHILPGIDDGAQDLTEALEMAAMAVEIGTTVMAATPHRFWHGRDAPADWLIWHRVRFQRELDNAGIPLKIVNGTEIPIGPNVAQLLAENRLSRLGGPEGKYALIEPPFDRVPRNGLAILEEILAAGITPILAHPERNLEIQRNLAFVEAAASLGVVIQLTSGSVAGVFSPGALATSRKIVEHEDWRIIIASDAHWSHDRTPGLLRIAADRAAEWTGDPVRAEAMVTDIPRSLLPDTLLGDPGEIDEHAPPSAL